jgi:hypothetical protein
MITENRNRFLESKAERSQKRPDFSSLLTLSDKETYSTERDKGCEITTEKIDLFQQLKSICHKTPRQVKKHIEAFPEIIELPNEGTDDFPHESLPSYLPSTIQSHGLLVPPQMVQQQLNQFSYYQQQYYQVPQYHPQFSQYPQFPQYSLYPQFPSYPPQIPLYPQYPQHPLAHPQLYPSPILQFPPQPHLSFMQPFLQPNLPFYSADEDMDLNT